MLVALLTILFLGGGADTAVLGTISDTRKLVKTVIVDDERRKEVTSTTAVKWASMLPGLTISP